jgi:hypothetical protein
VAALLTSVALILLLGMAVATFFALEAAANAARARANEEQANAEKQEANVARDRAITALAVSVWLADEREGRRHALAANGPWEPALAVVKDVRLRQPENAAAVLVSVRRFRLSVTVVGQEAFLREHWRAGIVRRGHIDRWTKLGAALYLRGEWRSAYCSRPVNRRLGGTGGTACCLHNSTPSRLSGKTPKNGFTSCMPG